MSVQRAILLDPGSSEASRTYDLTHFLSAAEAVCLFVLGNVDTSESAELIANLRTTISAQTRDLDALQQRVMDLESERSDEVSRLLSYQN